MGDENKRHENKNRMKHILFWRASDLGDGLILAVRSSGK